MSIIGNTPNNFQFNKIEKVNDFGINIHHAFFRDGDSQIGRWWQIDSKPNPSMSLYAMMGNNPMRYTDPMGGTTIVNNRGTILKQYGKDNSVFLQGKKGKLEAIGEIGKSINISKILPNILRENRDAATKMGSLGFANAVRPAGKWDYKNKDAQKGNIFGVTAQYEKETDKKTSFMSGKLNFVEGGSDVGNFNFGYTGRYANGGYSPLTLWAFGGVLQIGKDLIKGKFGKAFGELDSVTPIIHPPFGDEQDDFIWTTTGIIHANNEKKNN